MKYYLALLFTVILYLQVTAGEEIVLTRGQVYKMDRQGHSSILISEPQILSAREINGEIFIKAKSIGESKVIYGQNQFKIKVIPKKFFSAYKAIKKILVKMMGLEVSFENSQILLSGNLYRFEDWLVIASQFSQSKSSYKFRARIDPDIRSEIKTYFLKLFHKHGLYNVQFNFDKGLEIFAPKPGKKMEEFISLRLRPYGINVMWDHHRVKSELLVKVKIIVAELSKNFRRQIGVNHNSQISAQLIPKFTDQSHLQSLLNLMENQGNGQILARPNLLANSGSTAEFLAGGEIPIQTFGYKTQNLIWKRHGIYLKVSPKANYTGRINLDIETEVSTIDTSTSVGGIPGLKSNKVKTKINLVSGQSVAISGLLRNFQGKSTEGLPWLQSIPIIGPLFSSQSYLENQSELIVFVIPTILDPDNIHSEVTYPKSWKDIKESSRLK